MHRRIRNDQPVQEVPKRQRRPVARALAYYAKRYSSREGAIVEACGSGAHRMREIGVCLGVGRMTVSRVVTKRNVSSGDAGVQWETGDGLARG